jgi:hypothetical protein
MKNLKFDTYMSGLFSCFGKALVENVGKATLPEHQTRPTENLWRLLRHLAFRRSEFHGRSYRILKVGQEIYCSPS